MRPISIMRGPDVERRLKAVRWARFSPFRCSNSAFLLSQGVVHPWRQETPPHHVQVRQCKHRQRADRVLVDATVAGFGESPQTLDHVEGELASGAASRAAAVDRLLVLSELLTGFCSAIHAVTNACMLAVQPVILAPVGLIAVE